VGAVISTSRFDAVIFDLDGVVTQTSAVHAAAWKRLFDGFLEERADAAGSAFVPFDLESDYRLYVDGKPRYNGVQDFLTSRGIELPWGSPSDAPGNGSVCALGNRKDELFVAEVKEHGVKTYPTTIALIHALHEAGLEVGLMSSSRNTAMVLAATGTTGLFDQRVDGVVSDQLGLAGKPDPGAYLETARRLGVEPVRAVVVEDALSGVEAGRRGGFGLVIGVDRLDQAGALLEHGADVVVPDLADVSLSA
jgi:HAD superfamily hydrolase (TIGR01509 family)